MNGGGVIVLDRVTISGGSTVLVRELSLAISEAETLAVVGPSGCGKTTLLRTIAGLHRPTSGSVTVEGGPPTHLFGTGRIQYLHQDPTLWGHLTVHDNISLALRLLHAEPDPKKIATITGDLGLAGSEHKFPRELSKGMKARLALARVFAKPPNILLVDEPFASLDTIRREALNEQLRRLRREARCTTVIVTHDIVEALRFATRLLAFSPADPRPKQLNIQSSLSGFDPNALPPEYLARRDEILQIVGAEVDSDTPRVI